MGRGIRIAILDTGVDYTHPDLEAVSGPGARWKEDMTLSTESANPMDDHGHGTHVAATAAGNGAFRGVAPEAKIYAYKVLSASGSGSFSGIIEAIERAIDPNGDGDTSDHVDVISMSLGGSPADPDDAPSQAVDHASSHG